MDKPVQTALASFGMSGRVFHGPLLKVNPRFCVKKILERTGNHSAGMFPGAEIVREFDALLNDPEVELVIVNTPDSCHYEMAKKALLAGKHVVVEKPFTFRSTEADELIILAEKAGVLLTVYQNRRWDGDFLTVRKVIESGVLGRIAEFESHFDRYRPDMNLSSWKEQGDEYSGVLYNLGSHMVDQAVQLFGIPEAVTAHLRIIRPGGKVCDYYDIRLHYSSFSALLKCSYLVREPGPRYIVHGTKGSYLKWGIDPQEELLKNGVLPTGESWGTEEEKDWGVLNLSSGDTGLKGKVVTLPGNYPAFYENLYGAVRHGLPPAVEPKEARNVIHLLELCLDSNREKRTIARNR
jgi:predicted dehydrogenase